MNISNNAILHNKFEVSVVDVNTGKVRQSAVGYNTILDTWFKARLETEKARKHTSDFNGLLLYQIHFGTGTGTISTTRTSLFQYLDKKLATTIEESYGYPTSYIVKQIKLEANEYVGSVITETGFGKFYDSQLMTHALLQDSEGNQIAINKKDTDVVYITATFYCTMQKQGFDIYPKDGINGLAKWVLNGDFGNESVDEYWRYSSVRFSRFSLVNSSEMLNYVCGGNEKYTGTKQWDINTAKGNATTGTFEMPILTFLDSECNNRIVKCFGSPDIGAFSFPNHEVFPPYKIERLPIGTGDGVTTEFNIKCPLIMKDSDTIYVNNSALVRNTDYTIDYESNCGDWYENYHTAGLNCKDNGVLFGDLKTRSASSSNLYRDPFAWWNCYDKAFYPSSCQISEANPIFIDFGSAKACNTMKFELITIPAAQINNLIIQYSSDGSKWVNVTATRTSQVWRFDEISARYWRVYIPSYTLSVSLVYNPTVVRGNQTFGTIFFLGKTTPGLKFTTPPPLGASIEATYSIEYPFKTANNLLRFTYTLVLQRG